MREARANLTTRRVRVGWDAAGGTPPIVETLTEAGFASTIVDVDAERISAGDDALARHVKALAVAGFAAGNVMMLSIAVWSGAEGSTRALFHALSAAIALPALAYAGRLFFTPAWRALRHGRVNMDVPISIGIVLTAAMSVHDAAAGGAAVYFDAALMLVFFLLVGRTLELRMRARARDAADAVARFEPRGADVLRSDGERAFVPLAALREGDRLALDPGERLAVDAEVERGRSSVDRSLLSGESAPLDVAPGARLHAGTLNLVAPLTLRATADARGSFLAAIREAMREAETTKGRYRRVADRAAVLYAPLVHTAAALSFLGWLAATGDPHRALGIGVAVLIITCPCALGLAVPVVQTVAARRLFELGVLTKDGAALERLAEVDTALVDKTGTLTTDRPAWTCRPTGTTSSRAIGLARALARRSVHPHARALMHGLEDDPILPASVGAVTETPGAGLEARTGAGILRLGRRDWALAEPAPGDDERRTHEPVIADASAATPSAEDAAVPPTTNDAPPGLSIDGEPDADASASVLSLDGRELATFRFRDAPRADARRCIDGLVARGLAVELLSGDAPGPVARLAAALGIARRRGAMLPADKLARVRALEADGHRVLMIGDGVNDAPALAAAHASMAPGSATDVGRRAADFVLLGDRLARVPEALSIADRARRLVRQNMALAVLYNACALPLAVAGLVTPLIAALSMSLSSVLVIANALRLSSAAVASPATDPAAVTGPAPDVAAGPAPGEHALDPASESAPAGRALDPAPDGARPSAPGRRGSRTGEARVA